MNNNIKTLRNKLNRCTTRRKNLLSKAKLLESEIKSVEDELQEAKKPKLNATVLWCAITNALIAKYKPMIEETPERAYKELMRIEGALLAGKFLTEEELERGV